MAYAAVLAIWPKRPLPPPLCCWACGAGACCWAFVGAAAEVEAWRAWGGCGGAEGLAGAAVGRLGAGAGPRDWRGIMVRVVVEMETCVFFGWVARVTD